MGFPGGSEVKASACNAGDLGSIPGLGRSPGGRHGNPLQYSCLENPLDGGAWWATVHGVAKNRTRLSDFVSSTYFCVDTSEYVVLCLVTQLCLNFVTPWTVAHQAPLSMGILQARILEWVAMPTSRGSSQPTVQTWSPTLQADSLPSLPPGRHTLNNIALKYVK